MSRTVLWIVSIFLSLAMVALILVQAYWIRHAVESEEKQMNLTVVQILNEVSDEVVRNQAMITILDEIQPRVIQQRGSEVWNYHIDNRSAYGEQEAGMGNEASEEIYFYRPAPKNLKDTRVEVISDSLVVVIGQDANMDDTILVNAMKPSDIRLRLREELGRSDAFVNRIVRRMLVEEQDLDDKMSGEQIEALLDRKLAERGLDLPYEYAVYHEGHAPMFQSPGFHEFADCNYYRTPMFAESIFSRSTYISVFFPGEVAYLRHSTGMMGLSSILITFMVLLLFTLALYIMFKQKRLSEIKNDFVNNMTHELKTPISTISLASQMLNDPAIPAEKKNVGQISKIIRSESKQLGFQVERVLQMAIFDHGELKMKTEDIDVHDLIENVAQNFLLQLDRQGGSMDFLPEAERSMISGDIMHITNVISNLLENAMKYCINKAEISISTRNNANFLIVSINDKGIGISKTDQKRIFEKFYRVPSGNLHNVKGFGLGLSYVKLIVEAHGGKIHLKSELNQGSRFDIHLPLLKEEELS